MEQKLHASFFCSIPIGRHAPIYEIDFHSQWAIDQEAIRPTERRSRGRFLKLIFSVNLIFCIILTDETSPGRARLLTLICNFFYPPRRLQDEGQQESNRSA